jgi:hypothetical protein
MLSTMSAVSSPLAPNPTVSSCTPAVSSCDVVMSAVCHGLRRVTQAPTDQQAGSLRALTTCPLERLRASTTLSGLCAQVNLSKVDDLSKGADRRREPVGSCLPGNEDAVM